MIGEFKAFLLKTNALALAVGVIIGTALGGVVNSLVNDIIMPPIGVLLGGVDFSDLKIILKAAIGDKPEAAIAYGSFINAVVSFVIIAFIVWRISKLFLKETPAAPPAPSKTCPFCMEANVVNASKCRACTSSI